MMEFTLDKTKPRLSFLATTDNIWSEYENKCYYSIIILVKL